MKSCSFAFSNKHYNFFTTNICEKMSFIIHCWDLNLRPSVYESPPITTRPYLMFGPFFTSHLLIKN